MDGNQGRRGPAGVYAPVATTFGGDGELDLAGFKANLGFYATSALDGVVLLGSNGEFALLDEGERDRVVAAGVEAIAGRRSVMAGTGGESTRDAIRRSRRAAELGADFALVVTPHYYRPRYDRTAYLDHYRAVADASPIPVVVYVMAAYTGVDLASDLVAELSTHPNIVGVKDSGGNAPKVAEMIASAAPGFAVLAGSASFLYPALCLGATGGIVALGNVAPDQCAELARLTLAGEHQAARALQFRLLAPNAAVTSGYGIAGLKTALDAVGLVGGAPRPPLRPLADGQAEAVRSTLREAGIGAVVGVG
ncbi:MAG: 4-hydroxy-tetrahydrodipicolinate synthase [uncultured Thermomicrobiales bacterium]|uniref:4-hydroxy-tetrahydrodipicolinate synthase n=1 Tax=uncultured Thermomicrobiales bacterium TaxID=1645740 RepID=A0A6J4UIP9_9BACT|nr:MAG: 4-hydroxy-tetrahydrodipicolinate synthase [uncultured Thermomicrobiales bacterium]